MPGVVQIARWSAISGVTHNEISIVPLPCVRGGTLPEEGIALTAQPKSSALSRRTSRRLTGSVSCQKHHVQSADWPLQTGQLIEWAAHSWRASRDSWWYRSAALFVSTSPCLGWSLKYSEVSAHCLSRCFSRVYSRQASCFLELLELKIDIRRHTF